MEWMMRHLWMTILILLALFLGGIVLASGLGPEVAGDAEDIVGYGGPHSDSAAGSRSLFHIGVPIGGRKQGETYGEFNLRRNASATTDFHGFGCVTSCRATEEGYRWAAARKLTRPAQCTGPTWSFVEGCAAFTLLAR
jgi:hypothetical protein